MEDMAPELLEAIRKDFLQLLSGAQLEEATYPGAQAYAEQVGEALAESFRRHLSSAALPDGRLYWNIADRAVRPLLEEDHALVSAAAARAQQAMNDAAGIGLKAQPAPVDSQRIDGILNRVVSAERYDDAAWVLDEPVKTFSRSAVDETLRRNVEFQGKAGLSPRIIRRAESHCCKWCSGLEGVYTYPDVPKDVYRRHANCRCSVEYDPRGGKRKTLWSKGDAAQKRAQEERAKAYQALSEEERKANEAKAAARARLAAQDEQAYRKVQRGEQAVFNSAQLRGLKARRVTTYNTPVYVSDNVAVKPRALHDINRNTEKAMRTYGVPTERKPTVVIVSDSEMPTAWGLYDAIQNTVYYVPGIASDKFPEALGSVEYHEMWHLKQAENFRAAHGDITRENYGQFLQEASARAKKTLDAAGITEYNVDSVSSYAFNQYRIGRFDEVEAEIKIKTIFEQGGS